jgi:Domain of unknown function (DUF3846)
MKNYNNDELLQLAKDYVEFAEQSAKENPTSDQIQVVIIEPSKKPYKKTIANELSAFNDIVDGYIENVFIGEKKNKKFGIVVNEEGKLRELPVNRIIVGYDVLVGSMFITAYNYEGDNVSLTDAEADRFIRLFTPVEVYL